jgi:two-component system, NtrC family, response regulator HydG
MYVLAGISPERAANAGKRALVLDDNAVSCNVVVAILGEAGYPTDTCTTGGEALFTLARGQHKVVVIDQHGSSIDSLDITRQLRAAHPAVSIIVLAGEKALEPAVGALQAGLLDFMTKSFDLSTLAEHLLDALRRTFDDGRNSGVRHAILPAPAVVRDPVHDVLVGECGAIEQARQEVRTAARHDTPVLIIGEHGTEKAGVARFIHGASQRQKEPFEVVNTSQIDASTDLLAALRTWSDARRGTLFFPEVSSLNSVWQVELVKLLSGLGPSADAPRPRIIAGLSQPPDETWEGSVLARLFERMGGGQVLLPPLRERGRDMVILAEHFAEQGRLARGDATLRITPTAVEALTRYAWPGNVDELRLAIQHAASLCVGSVIRVVDLPPGIGLSLKGSTDESGTRLEVQSLEDMELSYILRVLDAVGGNKASAARLLGVDRTTLYRKLQRQELNDPLATAEALPAARRARK